MIDLLRTGTGTTNQFLEMISLDLKGPLSPQIPQLATIEASNEVQAEEIAIASTKCCPREYLSC